MLLACSSLQPWQQCPQSRRMPRWTERCDMHPVASHCLLHTVLHEHAHRAHPRPQRATADRSRPRFPRTPPSPALRSFVQQCADGAAVSEATGSNRCLDMRPDATPEPPAMEGPPLALPLPSPLVLHAAVLERKKEVGKG